MVPYDEENLSHLNCEDRSRISTVNQEGISRMRSPFSYLFQHLLQQHIHRHQQLQRQQKLAYNMQKTPKPKLRSYHIQ